MIALYGKTLHDRHVPYVVDLLAQLRSRKVLMCFEKKYAELLQQKGIVLQLEDVVFSEYAEVQQQTELLFSMGGDGTILECLTLIRDAGTPILGVNFGRLGFLATVGREHIESVLDAILQRNYLIDERTVLSLSSNLPLFEQSFALNEMTIQRKDQSSMITIHTYLNGELLNAYWADGLIVSTPTGSTGYNLSCGGPILHPSSRNFILTPVAPHNLNVRPMVVNDDVVLSFRVTGRGNSFLCTLDSRFQTIDASCQLAVSKAPFTANLVRLNDVSFLNALRTKLNWGTDQRNI